MPNRKQKRDRKNTQRLTLLQRRRIKQRDEEFQRIGEWFKEKTTIWNFMEKWFRLRVRWQWLAISLLVICVICWVLGLHLFGHIGLAMAIEQVLHKLGERTIAFVEEIN